MTSWPVEIVATQLSEGIEFLSYAGDYGGFDDLNETYALVADSALVFARRLATVGVTRRVDTSRAVNKFRAWASAERTIIEALVRRLELRSGGVDPSVVSLRPPPFFQVLGQFSARAIDEVVVLLANDTLVQPDGTLLYGGEPYDPAKAPISSSDLAMATQDFLPFSAFWGWQWAANWWWMPLPRPPDGDDWRAFTLAASERARHRQARIDAYLDRAPEGYIPTGAWDSILDQAATNVAQTYVRLQARFRTTMNAVAGADRLRSTTAIPWQDPSPRPTEVLTETDENDVQAQQEQFDIPYLAAHSIDYFRRPGRPKPTAHPERWTESGTGEQVGFSVSSLLMRGAGGVGTVPWDFADHQTPDLDDPRLADSGRVSALRSLGALVRRYGAWLRALEVRDQVAIVVSDRMTATRTWASETGGNQYFSRLFEAYTACLFAHHPASFIFSADIAPGDLNQYRVILVVGQVAPLEPSLERELREANLHGSAILYDATCRKSPLPARRRRADGSMVGAIPLKDGRGVGFGFDHFEAPWGIDPENGPIRGIWNHYQDDLWWRMRREARVAADVLKPYLDARAKPAAEVDEAEIWVSRHGKGSVEIVFVVNAATTPLRVGELRRITVAPAVRTPLSVEVNLGSPPVVYDVLAMEQLPPNQPVRADVRDTPLRIFAILPSPISHLHISAPDDCRGGEPINWAVEVLHEDNKPVSGPIPLHVRLSARDGRVVNELNRLFAMKWGA